MPSACLGYLIPFLSYWNHQLRTVQADPPPSQVGHREFCFQLPSLLYKQGPTIQLYLHTISRVRELATVEILDTRGVRIRGDLTGDMRKKYFEAKDVLCMGNTLLKSAKQALSEGKRRQAMCLNFDGMMMMGWLFVWVNETVTNQEQRRALRELDSKFTRLLARDSIFEGDPRNAMRFIFALMKRYGEECRRPGTHLMLGLALARYRSYNAANYSHFWALVFSDRYPKVDKEVDMLEDILQQKLELLRQGQPHTISELRDINMALDNLQYVLGPIRHRKRDGPVNSATYVPLRKTFAGTLEEWIQRTDNKTVGLNHPLPILC